MLRRTFATLMAGARPGILASPADPVTGYIRRNAVSTRNLSPLKRILAGVQVLGVGECNHGASEIQSFKDHLFRFLVREMGFTIFAIEGAFSAWKALNRYILGEQNARDEALSAQGYLVWDSIEMAAQVDWMRRYNQGVPRQRKVRLIGLDIAYTAESRSNVLAFLKQHAPDRAAAAESTLRFLDDQDVKWPRRIDTALFKRMLPEVQSLAAFFRQVAKDTPAPFDPLSDPVWDMNVIEQCVQSIGGGPSRSVSMAQNLLQVLDRYPGAKVLVSAFNSHVSYIDNSIGQFARQRLGDRYFSLASEFGTGSFNTRIVDPDLSWSRLNVITPPDPPQDSLPWRLAQANKGSFILSFRNLPGAVSQWFAQPRMGHSTSWGHNPDPNAPRYTSREFTQLHDGVFYLDRIQPTHPTPKASEAIRQRLRF